MNNNAVISIEQLMLLNNLMYLNAGTGLPFFFNCEGKSLSEVIDKLDITGLRNVIEADRFISEKDWNNILGAIKADSDLGKMTILSVHKDYSECGGISAVFADDINNEAVVVFCGTSADEWIDNFKGGYLTDTPCQISALKWYQKICRDYILDRWYVTVTGHSKGGNKAKYITIVDDSVNRCVSFDGQGFSTEFLKKYDAQIEKNEYKIHNHNVEYDYVSILLNDIGEKTYYQGFGIESGRFVMNHSAKTFLTFDDEGMYTVHPASEGQAPVMKLLSGVINGYLKTVTIFEKKGILTLLGILAQTVFGNENKGSAADIVRKPANMLLMTNLILYIIKCEKDIAELRQVMQGLMGMLSGSEFGWIVDIVDHVKGQYQENSI